jgi:hypothetical protein
MGKYRVLSDQQVQSFLDDGYLVVKDCVDPAFAQRWIDEAYHRLGYDKNDPSTFAKDIIWMDHKNEAHIRDISPKAWDALIDVIGSADRLEDQVLYLPKSGHFTYIKSDYWSDAFIVNFHRGADEPWQEPGPQLKGWHKDGSYFRHFIDSREQALLTIVAWTDMRHQGGATLIAPDSVRVVARFLYEHPEGVPPKEFDYPALLSQCQRFIELTADAGDFVILHPFMLHASSNNILRRPRFMSNPPIVLKEPMNLNRENPEDFSLLERATLHYLGLERLDVQPQMPRETTLSANPVPARV